MFSIKFLHNLAVVLVLAFSVTLLLVPPVRSEGGQSIAKKPVITLEEVAILLQVKPKIVAQLARQHKIPAQLVGGYWRFNRQAVMEWLRGEPHSEQAKNVAKHERESTLPHASKKMSPHIPKPSSKILSRPSISQLELPKIAGRGSKPSASGDNQKTEAIGERPELTTADEMFLRQQQVLLKPKQLTLEVGLFYTKAEQDGLLVIPRGDLGFFSQITSTQTDQDVFTAVYTGRYGLGDNLQLSASIPLIHRITDSTSTSTLVPLGIPQNQTSSTSLTEFGSLDVGLRYTLVREGFGYPDVIVNLDAIIPTRHSSYGLATGVALIKRFDPGAVFANFNYQRTFSRELLDTTRLQPENTFTTAFGYALSMNDTLAISNSVTGVFTTRTTFDNPLLPSLTAQELISMRFALTALITEKLYAEPSVSFALNGPSNVTMGVNFPYTFTIPTWETWFGTSDSSKPAK